MYRLAFLVDGGGSALYTKTMPKELCETFMKTIVLGWGKNPLFEMNHKDYGKIFVLEQKVISFWMERE